MDEFLRRLIEELQPYLNEDEVAYDVKVMVNNGVTENRIALRKDKAPTGPTIRVDGLVQAYNKGEVTMEMAARLVMNLFRHEESKNVHVPYVTEFTEDVAKRVRMMFVNQEKNKERLERGLVPFVRFEDCGLAGTFFVAGTTEDGEPKVRTEWAMHISYEMLKYWGCDLSAEDLFELSMKNLNAEDDTCIIATLDADVLNKKSGEVKSVSLPLEMYMVSLRSRNYGASAILADSVREQLREILQEDKVFVLLSSVHENIVVRYKPEYAEMFSQMVKDVNREVVDEKEILSDDIFEMDLVTGKLKKYEI